MLRKYVEYLKQFSFEKAFLLLVIHHQRRRRPRLQTPLRIQLEAISLDSVRSVRSVRSFTKRDKALTDAEKRRPFSTVVPNQTSRRTTTTTNSHHSRTRTNYSSDKKNMFISYAEGRIIFLSRQTQLSVDRYIVFDNETCRRAIFHVRRFREEK